MIIIDIDCIRLISVVMTTVLAFDTSHKTGGVSSRRRRRRRQPGGHESSRLYDESSSINKSNESSQNPDERF